VSEDFEKWFAGEHGVPQDCHVFARAAYQFRQPEIDALTAENERLRKDAERYRHLRNALYNGDFYVGEASITMLVSGVCPSTSNIDEAIDAAMKDFSTTRKEV
jgi:hypothetical protein